MTTIYLSSTYEDLKEYRRVVYDALRSSGYQVIAMEDYIATDQRPIDKYVKDVEAADIYLGIFGFFYGYVPPRDQNPSGLSITEIELRHAESLQKPCLIFLLDKSTNWPPQFVDSVSSSDKGERIKKLREYLSTQRIVSYFSDPHELADQVLGAVRGVAENVSQPTQTVSESAGSSSGIANARRSGEGVGASEPFDSANIATEKPQTVNEITQTRQARTFGWRVFLARAARAAAIWGALGLALFGSYFITKKALSSLNDSLTSQLDFQVCGSVSGSGPEMIVVQGGTFEMGDKSENGSPNERPVHGVTVRTFAISACEVTFDEYDQFAKATNRKLPDDRGWGRGRRPIIFVLWEDANAYVKWLSEETGKRYRLPTEAEWEYGARAGTKTEYWRGDKLGKGNANCDGCGSQWDNKQTAPVGSFKPNSFGLHDTAGNVWEWVEDCWHENYNGALTDGRAWREENGGQCRGGVFRSGSSYDIPVLLRSSFRYELAHGIGFRLAQDLN